MNGDKDCPKNTTEQYTTTVFLIDLVCTLDSSFQHTGQYRCLVVYTLQNPIAGVLVLATNKASPSLSLAPGQSRKAKVGRCWLSLQSSTT